MHDQHGDEQSHSHDPQIDQNSNRDAENQKTPDVAATERAMRQIQADHEHAEKRDVFRVEKRMRVQTRM